MAHRQLLTDEERQAFFGIPLDADSMARCFTLSRADQELVAKRRRDANRIGFAVQLALLRHPALPWPSWSSPPSRWFSGWQGSSTSRLRRSQGMRVARRP
jgi:hypothetical protein